VLNIVYITIEMEKKTRLLWAGSRDCGIVIVMIG